MTWPYILTCLAVVPLLGMAVGMLLGFALGGEGAEVIGAIVGSVVATLWVLWRPSPSRQGM